MHIEYNHTLYSSDLRKMKCMQIIIFNSPIDKTCLFYINNMSIKMT